MILVVTGVALFACKTTKIKTSTGILNPISTKEIIYNCEQNAFDYDYLNIKKISCHYTDKNQNLSFRASLKAIKDEQIEVLATKVGFPIARLLVSPDSILYINYFKKEYLKDDYASFSQAFKVDLDFTTIQAMLANRVFSHQSKSSLHKLQSSVEDGLYVLSTRKKQNPSQKMFFLPAQFLLNKLFIENTEEHHRLEVNFDDFISVEDKMYPSSVDLSYQSEKKNIGIKAKMSNISTKTIEKRKIKIPKSYKRVQLKRN